MSTPDMAAFARAEVAGRDLAAEPDFPHALWRRMGEAGLFRIGLPAAHGGTGAGAAAIAAAERDLIGSGGSPGLASCWAGHQMVARHYLAGHGSEAQQARFLPAMASGTLTAAVAISEPGVGAHPKHLTTEAVRDGDGWVLNGAKSYASNGAIAGLFVVLAITTVVEGRKRYSCFLVPRDAPGLTVVAVPTLAAMHPSNYCGLRLDGVRLPADALLGPEGTAYETMALPFRDAEDAVSAVGLAATLQLLVQAAASAREPAEMASLGELAGLAAVAAVAAMAAPAALDSGTLQGTEAQAVLIGVRQVAGIVVERVRAMGDVPPRLERLLAGVELSLSVARGPRQARAERLGAGIAGRG